MAIIPDAFGQIRIEIDTVQQLLARLATDLNEFPDPDAVATTHGPRASQGTLAYSLYLGNAAKRAKVAVEDSRAHLLEMDTAIREVVANLTALDEGAEDDARRLLNVMDDAASDAKSDGASEALTASSSNQESGAFGGLS